METYAPYDEQLCRGETYVTVTACNHSNFSFELPHDSHSILKMSCELTLERNYMLFAFKDWFKD
ncbi:MAG TPA: hypothetical protein VFS97_01680 [Nitrososphaeraceae archaeon]|nr:hypothetical protein [Nitrososphaeraceae archaeon]